MSKRRLWLPLGQKPKPVPLTERDYLINRLHEARTLVPDAATMDIRQLRDITIAQEERMRNWEREQTEKQRIEALNPQPVVDVAQIKGALREYIRWRRRKRVEAGLIPKEWLLD